MSEVCSVELKSSQGDCLRNPLQNFFQYMFPLVFLRNCIEGFYGLRGECLKVVSNPRIFQCSEPIRKDKEKAGFWRVAFPEFPYFNISEGTHVSGSSTTLLGAEGVDVFEVSA